MPQNGASSSVVTYNTSRSAVIPRQVALLNINGFGGILMAWSEDSSSYGVNYRHDELHFD